MKDLNIFAIVIPLLQQQEWFGVSDNVEIAKGKYEIPDTLKKGKIKLKRAYKIMKANGKVRN